MKRLLFPLLAVLGLLLPVRAELPALPRPATSFGATIADGWLYIYGGNTGKAHEFHNESVRGDFFRLQLPGGQEWEKLEGGLGLLSPSLVTYKGTVIRLGGMNARNAKGAKNDLNSTAEVMSFDPKNGKWSALPPLPKARSSHDAAVVGDILYVGGGWELTGVGDGDWHTTALTLDLSAPEKGWKSIPQPFERRAIAVVPHQGRVWFIGGMDSDDKPSLDVAWFDPAKGTWGQGPALPEGPMKGFGIAACEANDTLYVSPLSGKISKLNADASAWEEVTTLAAPRFFHRLLPMADGRLLAVGGSSRSKQIEEMELISLTPAPAAKPSAKTGEWPQWRGPKRDGISPETGWLKQWPAAGPKSLWKAAVGTGMSSPVIAQGRLIAHGNDGQGIDTVWCMDAITGATLWKHSFPCASQAHEMPIVPPGSSATPTISGDRVFALSREGDLFSLDFSNGRVIWQKNLLRELGGKRPVYGYAQSPLIDDGRLFLDIGAAPGATGSTVALNPATGETLWKAGTGEAGYSSARSFARDGKKLVAMLKGEALDVFEPANGNGVWSYRTTVRDFANAVTPTVVGHQLLVSNTGTDQAALLDWDQGASEPKQIWTNKQFALLFNSPIATGGCLFAFNEKRRGHHEFTCVDEKTGESRWVSDAIPTGTFILADNHWLVLTREGEVVLAPATSEGLKPTARFKALETKCYATPALADNRLYVRSNAGELAAFDLHQ